MPIQANTIVQRTPTPAERYRAAYERAQTKRAAAAEASRIAEQARINEHYTRLCARLAEFIPAEALADWDVRLIAEPYHDGPELELVPRFAHGATIEGQPIDVKLRVHIGTGYWYHRAAIRVWAFERGNTRSYYIDKGADLTEIEEVLAAALYDEDPRVVLVGPEPMP